MGRLQEAAARVLVEEGRLPTTLVLPEDFIESLYQLRTALAEPDGLRARIKALLPAGDDHLVSVKATAIRTALAEQDRPEERRRHICGTCGNRWRFTDPRERCPACLGASVAVVTPEFVQPVQPTGPVEERLRRIEELAETWESFGSRDPNDMKLPAGQAYLLFARELRTALASGLPQEVE